MLCHAYIVKPPHWFNAIFRWWFHDITKNAYHTQRCHKGIMEFSMQLILSGWALFDEIGGVRSVLLCFFSHDLSSYKDRVLNYRAPMESSMQIILSWCAFVLMDTAESILHFYAYSSGSQDLSTYFLRIPGSPLRIPGSLRIPRVPEDPSGTPGSRMNFVFNSALSARSPKQLPLPWWWCCSRQTVLVLFNAFILLEAFTWHLVEGH